MIWQMLKTIIFFYGITPFCGPIECHVICQHSTNKMLILGSCGSQVQGSNEYFSPFVGDRGAIEMNWMQVDGDKLLEPLVGMVRTYSNSKQVDLVYQPLNLFSTMNCYQCGYSAFASVGFFIHCKQSLFGPKDPAKIRILKTHHFIKSWQ